MSVSLWKNRENAADMFTVMKMWDQSGRIHPSNIHPSFSHPSIIHPRFGFKRTSTQTPHAHLGVLAPQADVVDPGALGSKVFGDVDGEMMNTGETCNPGESTTKSF